MKSTKKYFQNKICWITGASSGIGKELAITLSELGAIVYISGRSRDELKNVAAKNKNIIPIPLDVCEPDQWKKAILSINQMNSHLDLVIFNAGCCEYLDLPKFDVKSFERVIKTNFMGIVYGLDASLPLVRKSESGHIVAVTSSVASLPLPRAEAYGSSKAAASYLMNSLRLDLASENIEVSIVLPGFVDTPMTDKNDFPMPFKISSSKASEIIINKLKKRKKEIYFPRRFTWPLRLLSILPISIQCFFTKRMSK